MSVWTDERRLEEAAAILRRGLARKAQREAAEHQQGKAS